MKKKNTDKLTKFFNKETKEFLDFVQSSEDIKVIVLDHIQIRQDLKKKDLVKYLKLRQVGAMVQISLCNENSAIKVCGQGSDILSAFYSAKNKLIKALIEIQTSALQDEQPDSLPSHIVVQKNIH